MASKLKSARDQCVTIWEALTPPTNPARTYAKLTGKEILDGASGNRTFYFVPPSSSVMTEFSSDLTVWRYTFDARLRLSTVGATIDGTFDDVVDEAILFCNALNNSAIWPAGVRSCITDGYEVDDIDSDDLEIVITIVSECEESDG